MISPETDPVGVGIIETMAAIGFDYIELSLADLAAMDERRFADLARRIEGSGLRCEACNNFFPRSIRLTGPDASPDAALEYARRALDRAARLGVRIIVFGSAGAKNVPEGFPRRTAWEQIADLLRALGPLAKPLEITIAIEPINRLEANIINLAAEGLRLAREVNHDNVQLLIDYYHLAMEHEDSSIIEVAGPAVRHLHFAQIEKRRFPAGQESDGMRAFFRALDRIRYTARCSIEAFTNDFPADARRALAFLRTATAEHN